MKNLIMLLAATLTAMALSTAHGALSMRELAMAHDSLTSVHNRAMQLGDYLAAQKAMEQDLKQLKKTISDDHDFVAAALYRLSKAQAATGDWDNAFKNASSASTVWSNIYGLSNLNYAIALSDASYYNARRTNLSYAKNDAAKAMEIAEKLDNISPVELGQIICNLAYPHFLLGEYDNALQLADKAISMLNDNGAKQTPEYGIALSLLSAATSRTQSTQDNAIAFAKSALDIQQRLLPAINFDKAVTLSRLSLANMRKYDSNTALKYGSEAIAIWDSLHTMPVEYEDLAWQMATLYNANGHYETALTLCNKLQKNAEENKAINSLMYANYLMGGSVALNGLEQYDQAIAQQEKAIK